MRTVPHLLWAPSSAIYIQTAEEIDETFLFFFNGKDRYQIFQKVNMTYALSPTGMS